MSELLPFVVVGIATGSVYALAGMSLVLTYKTSGIFNFAHGGVGTVAAYLFFELHAIQGLAWPIAALVCIVFAATVVGYILERFARALSAAPSEMKIVGTVGLLLAIQGVVVLRYGAATKNFPLFLPTHSALRVGGVNVGWDQVIIVMTALGAASALYLFFRYSRVGVAMRGAVDDSELLSLDGISPVRVARWSWAIGSVFMSIAGILLAPTLGLDAILLTLLIVQAFGAAAVGRFRSLPLTYLGGLLVGVGAALLTKFSAGIAWLTGASASLPFAVLIVMLLVTRRGDLVELGQRVLPSAPKGPSAGLRPGKRLVLGVTLALVLTAIPAVVGTRLPVFSTGLAYVVIFLSLSILVRMSGQISLCQIGFAAIGASTFSHLAAGAGLPWAVALVGAGLAAVPVGALIAIPAIRLPGLYLALATFGFGILLERIVYRTGLMFGLRDNIAVPRPEAGFLESDAAHYYVLLTVVALAAGVVVVLLRTRLGRLVRALRDSPQALATGGTNTALTRLLVFCISAFLAGVGGALLGSTAGSTNSAPFSAWDSLILLVVLAIAGPGSIFPAFLAGAAYSVVPSYFRSETITDLLPVLFGLTAMLVAMTNYYAQSLTGQGRKLADRSRHIPDRSAWGPSIERILDRPLERVQVKA